ncbi:hypothetical protein [Brucella intermedia]|uniref:hypothetical protein n=1 Tax=Brucella intermedia TaxID=94625 RepID=UPI00244D47B8|nr:hypothetical protein [Brucella intermedia]WGG61922.1 hypothetical protein QA414_15495 [Brucella intermedia]
MSDKEKLEKENEQFSSAILYVATAVYVGVCAMVFGALYAKLPSFVDAFLTLMKDYGTILAGIPVLVAVVVAKQQLDANRRQHVATVKRSLMERLDALSEVEKFSTEVLEFQTGYSRMIAALSGTSVNTPSVPDDQIRKWQKYLPFDLIKTIRSVETFAYGLKSALDKKDIDHERVQNLLNLAHIQAKASLRKVQAERQRLSQYWS